MSHESPCRRWPVVVILALLMAILSGEVSSQTESAPQPEFGPQPPCGNAAFPAYPELDHSPIVKVWGPSGLGRDWTPPACAGWTTPGFTTLVVTVARFRHVSGAEDLLHRVGAISKLGEIRYWSTTHKRWQRLIVDAYALSGPGPDGDRRRGDFSQDEIGEDKVLYFYQEDNLSGKAIYRMRIRSASPDRLVFDTENISTIRYWLMPLFHAGELQSIYFLERESRDVWRYYSMARTGRSANTLTEGHEASFINRAVAFYRYFADIPTDKEPPASP